VHVAWVLRQKLKLWENLRWYIQVYGFVPIFGCLQESTRLCHGRRKNLKTSKFAFFQTLFCNSWSQHVYLYHVLFVTMNICGIDCQKKQVQLCPASNYSSARAARTDPAPCSKYNSALTTSTTMPTQQAQRRPRTASTPPKVQL
jgi:hypothetical protein